MWLQHDGAPAHFSADVRSALDTPYPGRWSGRGGPKNGGAQSGSNHKIRLTTLSLLETLHSKREKTKLIDHPPSNLSNKHVANHLQQISFHRRHVYSQTSHIRSIAPNSIGRVEVF
ncbi:hypothetical protein TNCV_1274361 [Trichonephila clavipes]|nr:hypothetical protein TNCV_1274361 [Trichonephila clavipes]